MAGIVWWEVESPEPEVLQAFASSMFGWSFETAFADAALGADYWVISEGGQGIGGLQRAPRGRVPAVGTRVYVLVENLERALARAESLQATVERRRTALGGDDRWFATVREPSGVSIGLWTPNPPFD